MLAPAALLARLTPTHRILCITCHPHAHGLAVSDAYLANASPLPAIPLGAGSDGPRLLASLRDVIAERELVGDIGAVAFGLPMAASPGPAGGDDEERAVRASRDEFASTFLRPPNGGDGAPAAVDGSFGGEPEDGPRPPPPPFASLELRCVVDVPRLAFDDVLALAADEPEMWEGVAPWLAAAAAGARADGGDALESAPPSVHATVALNQFLWEHCGGWRNTFG